MKNLDQKTVLVCLPIFFLVKPVISWLKRLFVNKSTVEKNARMSAFGKNIRFKPNFLRPGANPSSLCQLQIYVNLMHFDIKYHLQSERGGCVICESDLISMIINPKNLFYRQRTWHAHFAFWHQLSPKKYAPINKIEK